MSIEYDILSSGSCGNAVVINGEILIDIGVPYKTIEQSRYLKSLKLVLLTHLHSDHFNAKTAKRLHEERPSIRWCMCDYMVPTAVSAGISEKSIDFTRPTKPGESSRALIYNNFSIVDPVRLVHDVPNCGWIIHIEKEYMFYATDTKTLRFAHCKNYALYMIESNYEESEIENRIADKRENGEYVYEYRVAQNHLSQEEALEWLERNAGPESKVVFLHQHK